MVAGLITKVRPVPVEVAAALSTAVVELVTDTMVSKLGIPGPVTPAPTSLALKAALAEVMVVEPLVLAPSVTVRGTNGVDGVELQVPPMHSTVALISPPARLVVS